MQILKPKLIQETRLEEIPQPNENTHTLRQILETFDPVSLKEIKATRLLKRMDTKYLFHESLLPDILRYLVEDYHVLDVDGMRMQRYKTRYYDTPDFELYRQHHNGQRDRFKLRVRSYLNTSLDFLTEDATMLSSEAAFENIVQELIDHTYARYEAVQAYLSN